MVSYILFGLFGAAAFALCSPVSYRRGLGDGISEGVALTVDNVLKDVANGKIRLVGEYVEFSDDSCMMPFKLDGTHSDRIPVEDIIHGVIDEASDALL